MEKKNKLEDFLEYFNTPNDMTLIRMGLIMISSSIPIKSMSLEELEEFERKFKKLPFAYTYRFIDLNLKIYNKINTRRRKLKSKHKLSNGK